MSGPLADLRPEVHRPHPLHTADRVWVQTNCYVDPWIEVVHALGLEPQGMLAFTLGADFEGDQFAFLKPPLEDLRRLYGIEVGELNLWRPVADHVQEQLSLGRMITVEVDSFHLPDTAGVSYGIDHVKSTIFPIQISPGAQTMHYFHNDGLYRLEAADYRALFCLDPPLPPYAETVRFDHARLEALRRDPAAVREVAAQLAAEHLSRAPVDNPMIRMGKRVTEDLDWLASTDMETFHRWAFGICRQGGAAAQLAGDFVAWLDPSLLTATERFAEAATQARVLQLSLTRAVRGRRFDIETPLTAMADAWAAAMDLLRARYAR